MTVFCSFVEALDSVYYDQHKGRVGRTVFCSFVEAQDSVYYDQQKGREGKGREGKGSPIYLCGVGSPEKLAG